mmetsp:Transcript_23195/g.64822  ORF Transcript_23195/g.64822 Transcript_23195/m.64822 type:complete len:255 (+) Transcript_23195:118-882(+)
MSGTREENLFMAFLAEQAGRYEDMVEYMKRVATMGPELNCDERNSFSSAFKTSVGARRQAWRVVANVVETKAQQGDEIAVQVLRSYLHKLELELRQKCDEVLDILSKHLVVNANDKEAKVFYLKMKGDYHRYQAEFTTGGAKVTCLTDAETAYQQATELANEHLPVTSHLRLGLALNFSVHYYEGLNDPEKACSLAKAAYDGAMPHMNEVDPAAVDDTAMMLKLIQDNLTLWTSAPREDGSKPPEQDGTEIEDM